MPALEQLIAGRFQVLEQVGGGGMGVVYKAHDRHLNLPVALKIVEPDDERAAERFAQEARLLAELDDARIVRYLAHGFTAGGALYLAMEWLEGEPLSERLARDRLTIGESVGLAREIAAALAVAHARGIVHRDVKPSNVFLMGSRLDRVKLLDFGIARWASHGQDLTRTGDRIGTPLYMSPEQVRGARNIEASADVWSLGCVLFQCVAGRAPFKAEHITAALAKILYEEAPRLVESRPDVPPALDNLVARMLAREPEQRPADGAELADLLERLGAVAPTPRAAPEVLTAGEVRLHTILVLEPGGAAGHSDGATVDADDTSPIAQAVQPFGGRVDWLPNGAAVVRFVHTDVPTLRARKAAHCALALRAILPAAAAAVITWRGPAGTLAAVGEVLDRALDRLAQHRDDPEPGVILDDLTAQLLDPSFDIQRDAAGPVLLRRRDGDTRRTVMGRATPFVGRDRELGTLLDVAEHCIDEPAARVVLVTGPSGVGKSRLQEELVRGLHDVRVWIARGDPVRAGTPLLMLGELVHRALRLDEAEDAERRRAAIRTRVGRVVEESEAGRVAEFLGEIVGVPFPAAESLPLQAARQDAMLMAEQVRRAWVDWLDRECAREPVVLVLEDLQWGDAETVKLIDSALRALQDRPLMVLALAQPQVLDLYPRLWHERGLLHLALTELSTRAATQLVSQTLDDRATPEIVARVVERAAGNAFFLEELIRAVVDGNRVAFSESILAVAHARLVRLSSPARRVLRAAAILGEGFTVAGVAALVGGAASREEIERPLTEAMEREVVVRRPARSGVEPEYGFRHSYLREAAYAMLTEDDRVRGHRLAGRWLAGRGDIEAAAAHHAAARDFPALGALIRDRAEELVGRGHHTSLRDLLARLPDEVREADPWLIYWTGVAVQPTAPTAARSPFEHAFQRFVADGDAAGAFLSWSGVVDSWFFDPTGVSALDRWYDELEALCARWPEPPTVEIAARVAATLFSVSARRHPKRISLAAWERRAWMLLEGEGSGFMVAPGLVLHYLFNGDLADAKRVVATVRPHAPAGSLAALYVDSAEAFQLWQSCDFDGAERLCSQGQRAARTVGLLALDFLFGSARAHAACCVGELELARAVLSDLDAAVPPGHLMLRAHLDFNRCWERLVAGDLETARLHGERSIAGALESGTTTGLAISRLALAEVLLELGRLDEVDACLAPVEAYAAETGSKHIAFLCLLGRAHHAEVAGRRDEQLRLLREVFARGRADRLTLAAWSARHETMRRTCATAIAAGIEPDFVAELAAAQRLSGTSPPTGGSA